jgi:hypothetical protein
MNVDGQRNLGTQPIADIMAAHRLRPHDLVRVSTEQLTHKMVARACKGRRLTPKAQAKVRDALNQATGTCYPLEALFNY